MEAIKEQIVAILMEVLNLIDDDTQYDDVQVQMQEVDNLINEHYDAFPQAILDAHRKLEAEMYSAKGAMFEVIADIEALLDALEQ